MVDKFCCGWYPLQIAKFATLAEIISFVIIGIPIITFNLAYKQIDTLHEIGWLMYYIIFIMFQSFGLYGMFNHTFLQKYGTTVLVVLWFSYLDLISLFLYEIFIIVSISIATQDNDSVYAFG